MCDCSYVYCPMNSAGYCTRCDGPRYYETRPITVWPEMIFIPAAPDASQPAMPISPTYDIIVQR